MRHGRLVLAVLAVLALAAPARARMLFDSESGEGFVAQSNPTVYWGGQCLQPDQGHVYRWRGLLQLKATVGGACGTGYESGAVWTPWFSYTYGWAAARVKVPCQSGFGLWPAWWSYDEDYTAGQTGGEIDTLEEMTGPVRPRRTVEQSLHSTQRPFESTQVTSSEPWCRRFHVYENHWFPGWVRFYVDGHLTHTFYAPGHYLHESPVLDVMVGYYGGTPRPWTLPESMLVDWVRVWR